MHHTPLNLHFLIVVGLLKCLASLLTSVLLPQGEKLPNWPAAFCREEKEVELT